jgi:hypothetical protein
MPIISLYTIKSICIRIRYQKCCDLDLGERSFLHIHMAHWATYTSSQLHPHARALKAGRPTTCASPCTQARCCSKRWRRAPGSCRATGGAGPAEGDVASTSRPSQPPQPQKAPQVRSLSPAQSRCWALAILPQSIALMSSTRCTSARLPSCDATPVGAIHGLYGRRGCKRGVAEHKVRRGVFGALRRRQLLT